MFAALAFLEFAFPELLAVPRDPPALVLSGEPLPAGALARFGVPHGSRGPSAAGFSDEGSFRIAVGDGKDVRVWTWHADTAVPPKHLLRGHEADVTRVSVAPDGRTVATADAAGGVRVWDLATGRAVLAVTADPVFPVLHRARPAPRVEVRGRLVFVPCKAGFAVRDTATGKKVEGGGDRRYFVAAFSPDGEFLATSDDKGKFDLWAAATGKHVGELPWTAPPAAKGDGFFGPKLGPGGAPIVPEGRPGLFYSIDPPSPEHDGGVLRIVFAPDGKQVYVGGASVVRAWDVATRKEQWRWTRSYYHTAVGGATVWVTDAQQLTDFDVSPDGRRLAVEAGRTWFLDAETGTEVGSRLGTGRDPYHTGPPGVAFHPNGRWLATHAGGNYADLWDVRTGVRVAATGGHNGSATGVAFSPDGSRLAVLGDDAHLDVFDLTRGVAAGRVGGVSGVGRGFGWTADGRFLVTGAYSRERSFEWIGVTAGSRVTFDRRGPADPYSSADAVCVDPRGPARILTAVRGQTVAALDLPAGKASPAIGGKPWEKLLNDELSELALAPAAGRLVIGYYNSPRRPAVIDLKSGEPPFELSEDLAADRVAVTADGKSVASVGWVYFGESRTILVIWDGATGKVRAKHDFGKAHYGGLAFSPDGTRLLAGVGDAAVLFGAATGKEVGRFGGHRGTVWGVAWSPDGRRAATCGADGQALVWDAAKFTRSGK